MDKKKYYKLFSCCTITRGASRSLICDMQRKEVYLIPNTLFTLFDNEDSAFELTEIEQDLDTECKIVLNEYISFLEERDLVYCFEKQEELKRFPPLNTDYLFPAHISNCLVDIDTNYAFINESFLKQLEKFCCNYIQLRFFKDISLAELQNILDLINPTQIKSAEIVLGYINEKKFEEDVLQFINKNRKVRNIIAYNAPRSCMLLAGNEHVGSVHLSEEKVTGGLHCGIVQFEQFAFNIPHYTESLHHNTCLNRKIAIDTAGNIKNCPSMKESFGNIKDTMLEEAINKPGFQKYWNIKKDEVSKCRDCEFRHGCTDCRAYVDDPGDMYSAPLKCGYDPYTCEWEEWSKNPLKQKAIDYYGMREILTSIEK